LKIVVINKPEAQGHQPVHQAGAGLRSKACPQGHQGSPAEGPEGHGQVAYAAGLIQEYDHAPWAWSFLDKSCWHF